MQNYAQIENIDFYSHITYLSFQLLHNHRILYSSNIIIIIVKIYSHTKI